MNKVTHLLYFNPLAWAILFRCVRSNDGRLAGTAVRFEPGETKVVSLVDCGGLQVVRGGNNLFPGPVSRDEERKKAFLQQVEERGFLHEQILEEADAPAALSYPVRSSALTDFGKEVSESKLCSSSLNLGWSGATGSVRQYVRPHSW